MSTEDQGIVVLILMGLILWVLISGSLWWVVLWSFNFPIAFAWKQLIGVLIITGMFAPKSISTFNTTKTKTKSKGKK